MANNKPQRTFNKDRIRRIKEASEQAKQADPHWYDDAPPSINPVEDENTLRSKTPDFLKKSESQVDLLPETQNQHNSKKLTLEELTLCTKDSSQLQSIMNTSANQQRRYQAEQPASSNNLESLRLRKMQERENFNKKIAENLDKASEKWHNQLKQLTNHQNNTQDSGGVRSSLFSDEINDNYEREKFEKESNEKSHFKLSSTDFASRLDLLLQKGCRSTSLTNLKNINEKSFGRWSSRYDSLNSISDLKYALLNNRMALGIHNKYGNTTCRQAYNKRDIVSTKSNVNTNLFLHTLYQNPYLNNSNTFMPPQNINLNNNQPTNNNYLNSPYNQSNFSNNPNQIVNFPNNPNIINNPQNFPNYINNPIQMNQPNYPNINNSVNYPNNINQNQQIYNPNTFNGYTTYPPSNPNNPFNGPIQNTYCDYNAYSQPYTIPPNPMVYPQQYNNTYPQPINQHIDNNKNKHPSENELLSNFDKFSERINNLSDKLEKLNETVHQLSLNTALKQNNIKPIIKVPCYESMKTISDDTDISQTSISGFRNCENIHCNQFLNNNNSEIKRSSRHVHFDDDSQETKYEDSDNNENNKNNDDNVNTKNKYSSKAIHPKAIQKKYNKNDENTRSSSEFVKFQLPEAVNLIMVSNLKRNLKSMIN